VPDPREIKQFIAFCLDYMSVDNAHHQFELICLELVKLNILENIIPATGPVAGVGDQGRDFLNFRTYLGENLEENSTFLGKNSSDDIVIFTCSIQENVLSKIKSDVNKIMEFGLPVDRIYFFSRENIKIGETNNLKKWALDTHEIHLEILDGNAITDFLARNKNHWIASRYLNIPETFFNPTDQSKEIQKYFNRINILIRRLKSGQFSVSDKILINTVGSLNQSGVKDEFGITISQTRRGADSRIEFLNGEYTLLIEIYIGEIRYGFKRGREVVDLENPYNSYDFYENLRSYVELNNGIRIELPLDLIAKVNNLEEIRENFEELISLFINLYRNRDHDQFVSRIVNSRKLQENLGISIRNPNRQDGNIADEDFYFCEKRYSLMPNSRYLRKRNDAGTYENIITQDSTNDEITQKLTDLFNDLITILKNKYPNARLSLDEMEINLN